MTVSAITGITSEGQPKELSSFIRSGVMYVVWTDYVGNGVGVLKKVRWKPHTSGDFTEVIAPLITPFNLFTALYHQATDAVVVIWDDGDSTPGVTNGNLYIARFAALTGAILSGPDILCQGAGARMCYRNSSSDNMVMFYRTPKTGGVYGRMSSDGGQTWQSGEAVYTNQVLETRFQEVVTYDSTHISLAQLGKDTKPLAEIGMLIRTRPLQCIVPHPTNAGEFYVGEPSKFDNVTLVDNLRGRIAVSTGGTKLYHLDGVAQGTSDTISAVARIQVTGTTITVTASAGPVAGVAGKNFVEYTLAPAQSGLNVTLPGATSYAVDFSVTPSYAYVAEYSDSTSSGQFVLVDLTTGTTTTVLSGLGAVRAVSATTLVVGNPIIFVATTESGVERLRVYQENGTTPTLLYNFVLPSRASSITAVKGTGSNYVARAYVSMASTFATYDFTVSSSPIRLVDSVNFPGGTGFFKSVIAPNGSAIVAAGTAGVVAYDPEGRLVSQLKLSGKGVSPWKPLTAYTLGALVTPRPTHPVSPTNYYFRCSTAGTSGVSEPQWALTGTMADATAVWTPQATVESVVTDVALDVPNKRVYAVGSGGGVLGTDGRVWILSASGIF